MTEQSKDEATTRPWDKLEELLDQESSSEVKGYLDEMTVGDQARCLERLDQGHRDHVVELLDAATAADLLENLPEAQATDLLDHAAPETAAAILEELPSDECADLVASLDPGRANAVLAEMAPELAEATRELASYPGDTAGGLMVREYLAYPTEATAGNVLEDLRRRVDEVTDYDVQYIYVTDTGNRLAGVIRLRDLILTRSATAVRSLMITDPHSVPVTLPLDGLEDLFDSTNFLGLPVIDEANRLLGVVHRRDVDEALEDRAESDHLKSQGIVGGEELRSMPILKRSGRRLSWLSVNILLNVMAASVIAAYQDTLSAVIALAVFLPIISDMSGCSGNQAVAVSMRELTLGVVKPVDVFYVWRKELAVGLINGLVLGLLIATTAWLWQGNAVLGAVIGVALALNTLVAVSIGGAVPLLLKRFGVDPALASGPILTTLTDMCGFFLVLSLAAAAMAHLS